VDKAKKLLGKSKKPITEIAFEVGLESPNYFSRLFRDRFGLSTMEYRRNFE